jgi:hypothetical protein
MKQIAYIPHKKVHSVAACCSAGLFPATVISKQRQVVSGHIEPELPQDKSTGIHTGIAAISVFDQPGV